MAKSVKANAEDRRRTYIIWSVWAIILVIVVVGLIILAKVGSGGSSSAGSGNSDSTLASSSLVSKITSLPASVFSSVGQGSAQTLPQVISGSALTKNGKPRIVYLGAEYCPYCAAERWAMVIALSRFGSFSGLRQSHSATGDVFPNTQTFSFHGASYTSQYIEFDGVETLTNQPVGSSYAPLDTPTSEELSLESTYDKDGSIPFIDFGNRYLISGASYSPQVLAGKSADEIASALSNPSSDIAQAVIGTANIITATICSLTGNQPANICTDTIKTIQAKIK